MNLEKLKVLLDESLTKYQVPSSDIIISKDNQIVFRYLNGTSDDKQSIPLSGDELYFLYSATKPITCTAALQLVEQGKLGLDDCVHQYIPEYRNVKVQTEHGPVPAENAITIKHLFTMTSGMDYNCNSDAIVTQLKSNPASSTLELVRAMASNPLQFQPGTHFLYSFSHDVLAAIIEIVSGMRYGEYLQTHIFDICDMKNTYVGCPTHLKNKLCSQYLYHSATNSVSLTEKENHFLLTPNYQSGGAGVVSCVNDYIKFARALVNGENLLKKETIERWRTSHISGDALSDFQNMKPGYSYGLGVRTNPGSNFSVKGEFGWDGAAGAYVLLDPDNHLAVFYITHVRGYGCYLHNILHPMIRDAVYDNT